MSRTDKDAPGWVRALNHPHATAIHFWRCETRYGNRAPAHRTRCDIDDTTNIPTNRCGYWLFDRYRFPYTDAPTTRRRHLDYFGPERTAVRDSLHLARRDYNAHGETDLDAPTRQTRHSDWHGGWWD